MKKNVWKKNGVCAGLASLALLAGLTSLAGADGGFSINGTPLSESQSIDEPGASVKVPAAIKRGFYLTKDNYTTVQAPTACAKGYHMASMWELLDVTTLIYHYKHPYAYTKADSGYGPPSSWYGWVRTGFDSNASATAGTGNCNNWTSTSNTDHTVAVRLTGSWKTAQGALGPWEATSFTCGTSGPVWCVSDKK